MLDFHSPQNEPPPPPPNLNLTDFHQISYMDEVSERGSRTTQSGQLRVRQLRVANSAAGQFRVGTTQSEDNSAAEILINLYLFILLF